MMELKKQNPSKKLVVLVSLVLATCSSVLRAQPANDLCENAAEIFLNQLHIGSTEGATGSETSSCSYKDRRDVWYIFYPIQSGLHTVSLRGSTFDTTLSVYDSCGGSELACNDDLDDVCSELVVDLTVRQEGYLIRIAGYDGDTGDYVLTITERFNQPINDECIDAIEVVAGLPFEGTTAEATGVDLSSCADNYDIYDVWHSFTPLATADYMISLCGSDFDTTLAVFDDCNGNEIACNDDDCDRQSKVVVTLNENQNYLIRVAGFDGDMGDYVLNIIEYLAQPQNDFCEDAIAVYTGITSYGTINGATGSSTSSCGQNDQQDVWYSFTPGQTGYHTISLCGSDFDTILAVYTQCNGQEIACNDDLCDVQSELVVDLTQGQTYIIRVAGNRNKAGDYALTVTERFQQPDNDECANAIEVFINDPFSGTNIGALGDTGSSCGYYFDVYDVWHIFTPPATADYLISLCDSDFDTTLAILDGCDGSEIICNDDSCGDQSLLVATLEGGLPYLIRVAGYDGDTGNYTLLITDGLVRPTNDLCIDAIPIVENDPFIGSTIGATGSLQSSCSDEDSCDVWHSFTPEVSSEYLFSLCGSEFDTTLAVFDGCGGTELACNDDLCGSQSELVMQVEQGLTYLIRVAGYRGAIGEYSLVVNDTTCYLPDMPDTPMPADQEREVLLDMVLAWDRGHLMTYSIEQSQVMTKGIYGADDRMEEYQVNNLDWLAVGDATVAMLAATDLIDNGNGIFSLPNKTFAERYLEDNGRPLCSDEPYRDQPTPIICTGILVAPDIVVTTGHCVSTPAECANTAFVFGFIMQSPGMPVTTIDQSQVYFGSEIIERYQQPESDWSLIRLDREVLDHSPLRIRRQGKIGNDQELFVAGYPMGLPRKYAGGASVQDNNNDFNFQANLDTFVGNSGSPVVNMQTMEVEGILYSGNADFITDGDCDRASVCPDEGCPGWEAVTRTTEFAHRVPSYDVYLGTDPDNMTLVCVDSPKPWCRINPLQCSTMYHWQVVAKNECGEAAGPVWSFSTQLTGDLDQDCDVDLEDFSRVAAKWQSNDCSQDNDWCLGTDMNRLGQVDWQDVQLLISNWLEQVDP